MILGGKNWQYNLDFDLKGQLAASAGGTDGLLFKNSLLDIDYAVLSLEDKRLYSYNQSHLERLHSLDKVLLKNRMASKASQ